MRSICLLSACGLLALTAPAQAEKGQQYGGPASDCTWLDVLFGPIYICYNGQAWEPFDPPSAEPYGGQTYGGQSYQPPPTSSEAERFRDAYHASEWPLEESIPAEGVLGAGLVVPARHIPADPPSDSTLPLTVHYLAQIRGDELALALDPLGYVIVDWSKRLAPRHKHDDKTYRAHSCEGFVYKRWYEYSRFEDAARTCGTDASCVVKVGTAWSSPGIAGPTLFQKAPGIHTIPAVLRPRSEDPVPGKMWMPYAVKNDFFAVDPATILRASTRYALEPAFAETVETLIPVVDVPPLHDQTNKMQWHVRMASEHALLGLSKVEQKDIAFRLARYRRLVEEYRQLRVLVDDDDLPEIGVDLGGALDDTGMTDAGWSSTIGFFGGMTGREVVPPPVAVTGPAPIGLSPEVVAAIAYRKVVDEMARLLMAEWDHLDPSEPEIRDGGCLLTDACDWQPEQFAADYLGRFQTERESDMQRCLQVAPPLTIPDTTWWAADVVTMDAYINNEIEKKKKEFAALPLSTGPVPGAPADSKNIHWGIQPVDESKGIRDLLHAEYKHHATADVAMKFRDGKICKVSAKVDAGILATYTAPDPDLGWFPMPHTLIKGDLDIVVNHGDIAFEASAYLMIADQQLFNPKASVPITGGRWAPPPQTTHFSIYDYGLQFSILGVPGYLSVQVQGDLSFQPAIRVPPYDEACNRAAIVGDPELTPTIEATIDSTIDVDADGRLAIGIPGFSVGVNGHIDVLTATVPAKATFGLIDRGGIPTLTLDASARLDATLMGGNLSVYAEAFVLYAEKMLFGWDGIAVGFDLWNTHVEFALTFLDAAFKAEPTAPVGEDS